MSIVGKYLQETSDNYEGFLKACGVGLLSRTAAGKVTATIEMVHDPADDTYTQKTMSTFKNFEIKFKSGVEFDEETAAGVKCKSTVTIDGNKLTHTQKNSDGVATTTRVFTPEGMEVTYEAKDQVAKRTYKRL